MLKVFNVIGVIVLLLLLRKLIWCLRWLWCWKHDREMIFIQFDAQFFLFF